MSSEQDLGAETDAAWAAFRARLADRLASMEDDDVLIVEFADAVVEDDSGSAPYVQMCAYGETMVQVEAVSNHWLEERCALSAADEEALLDLGWEAPTDDPGWENFHLTFHRRSADEVAVLTVDTLREVYAVPHPSFLDAAGLETDPAAAREGLGESRAVRERTVAAAGEEPVATFVVEPERLRAAVDDAMRVVYPDLRHDSDGDIPILAGQSALFVRVRGDRPAVEVFAELLVDVEQRDRLPLELDLLNASHPLWKFTSNGPDVTMRYELPAVPFAPAQLRAVVEQFAAEVDEIARALSVRVGGRRFFEADPAAIDAAADEDDVHPAMVGLLELLHLGRLRATTVVGLFEYDRLEIIRQIVRIRTGLQSCADHDPEVVLTLLRKALRIASDGEADPRRDPTLPPRPKPLSIQESLLPDTDLGDDALDLGWSA